VSDSERTGASERAIRHAIPRAIKIDEKVRDRIRAANVRVQNLLANNR
jgi:hypothetical protein